MNQSASTSGEDANNASSMTRLIDDYSDPIRRLLLDSISPLASRVSVSQQQKEKSTVHTSEGIRKAELYAICALLVVLVLSLALYALVQFWRLTLEMKRQKMRQRSKQQRVFPISGTESKPETLKY